MSSETEILGILEIMPGIFPNFQSTPVMVQEWCRLFEPVPYPEILSALDHFTKTRGTKFAPNVSEVFQALREINPARVPKFTGNKTERLASPEVLRRQFAEARKKAPTLYTPITSGFSKACHKPPPNDDQDWVRIFRTLDEVQRIDRMGKLGIEP